MSPQDAEKIGVKDGEWIECVNTNGVFVGRAVVSHRMPEGVCYVHHAQERMMTPKTETTGKRGGIHQLDDPHPTQADPYDWRLRTPGIRLQLSRTDRQPA